MKFLFGLGHLPPCPDGAAVTIGNFDGVHLGHQGLLRTLVDRATADKIPSVLMTFEPQPREFFAKALSPVRLTRLREKIHAVENTIPPDYFLALKFNQALASLSPEAFIEQVLHETLHARHIIVGEDFQFGANRAGNVETLREFGPRCNFDVIVVPQIQEAGGRISSSAIRQALAQGDLNQVEHCLGRPYSLYGKVIHGDKRGREWGFPTANLALYRSTPPMTGIFAVEVNGPGLDGLPGVASLGYRPAVGGDTPLLEVFLFDFQGDLYGKPLEVQFLHKLRDESDFDSLEALRHQIGLDVEAAKAFFIESKKAIS